LVAYGDAATVCLDVATKPMPHCTALVCYYPSRIPHPNQKYPSQLHLAVHLAEIQQLRATFPVFVYPDVVEGFAEHDLDQYDPVAADLAWSRSLSAVRRGFKQAVDLDSVKDSFTAMTLGPQRSASDAIGAMVQTAHVNYVPTGTGGIGRRALHHFYEDFFIPGSPPTLQTRLISRTSGVDRVVDEIVVSFRHTQEVPWMLPGVPPTGKEVQVAVVSVVSFRGGKLAHERVYWDQASVLAQIGLLDPKNVPQSLRSKGCRRLPVMGPEEARKVVNVHSVPSNELIRDW
jgi:ketosteroid isomerase-like protein